MRTARIVRLERRSAAGRGRATAASAPLRYGVETSGAFTGFSLPAAIAVSTVG